MIRFVGLALAGLLALVQPLNAAGTVPGFALTPQFDGSQVMPGCKLYVIQAGTTQTPQNSYQDAALTIPQPNPLVCDPNGRLPMFYLADGQIKLRLTNAAGSQKFVGDNIPVLGSSSGGGGGGTVDPTTIIATGDIKAKYGVGVLSGFVRANGRTIGSATSGATERANADTQALFEYLWNADPNLVVSTGRGVTSNADWVANKTISLPDWRGRALAALDDMGNSPAGVLTNTYFLTDATVLGASGGNQAIQLLPSNLPPYTPTGAVNIADPGHNHTYQVAVSSTGGPGGPGLLMQSTSPTGTGNSFTGISAVFLGNPQGGTSQPFSRVTPTKLATFYIKL